MSGADEDDFSLKSSGECCWRDHALDQRYLFFDYQFSLLEAAQGELIFFMKQAEVVDEVVQFLVFGAKNLEPVVQVHRVLKWFVHQFVSGKLLQGFRPSRSHARSDTLRELGSA